MDPTTARAIATEAHAGQTDKAGRPYIEHPERVAARLTDPDAVVVALLHDVLEDTELTADDLRAAGATDLQVQALETLTHADGVDDLTHWTGVTAVPLARLVKVADLADNTDPARVALLEPALRERLGRKYRRAAAVLLWDFLEHRGTATLLRRPCSGASEMVALLGTSFSNVLGPAAAADEFDLDELGDDRADMEFGLIAMFENCFEAAGRTAAWTAASGYAMDALTGMGEDPWSSGEHADPLSATEAAERARRHGWELFGPDGSPARAAA